MNEDTKNKRRAIAEDDGPFYDRCDKELPTKPVAFISPNASYRYLNPHQDKISIFSVKEAEIVLSYPVNNLKVFAINEESMTVKHITSVYEAKNFYEPEIKE